MNAKDAVATAKAYFQEVMGEPGTVEELWFDDFSQEWCVTLGRKRTVQFTTPSILGPNEVQQSVLDYKVVRVRDTDGQPVSIRNRETEKAA